MVASHPVRENRLVRHATAIAMASVTLVMTLGGLVFWQLNRSDDEARAWVDHSYSVRHHIRIFSHDVDDLVIGNRNFLLTGKPDALEHYRSILTDSTNPAVNDPNASVRRSAAQELSVLRGPAFFRPVPH